MVQPCAHLLGPLEIPCRHARRPDVRQSVEAEGPREALGLRPQFRDRPASVMQRREKDVFSYIQIADPSRAAEHTADRGSTSLSLRRRHAFPFVAMIPHGSVGGRLEPAGDPAHRRRAPNIILIHPHHDTFAFFDIESKRRFVVPSYSVKLQNGGERSHR